MSVSLTLEAVRDRRKTVTRRDLNSWKDLKAGQRLTLIEKGMGLPKGAKQVVVAEVEVMSVTIEPIKDVSLEEVRREGFEDMTPAEFIAFWLTSHHYPVDDTWRACRRIEWRYS